MAGDGPHHIDAERDARDGELRELRAERDRLLDFVRLVSGALDRADHTGISYTDQEAMERELGRLL
jgi:hypothetical protein